MIKRSLAVQNLHNFKKRNPVQYTHGVCVTFKIMIEKKNANFTCKSVVFNREYCHIAEAV